MIGAQAFDLDVDVVELVACPPRPAPAPLAEIAFRGNAWLPDELDSLRTMFAAGDDLGVIADSLGRGRAGVSSKLCELGLRRTSPRPWTELEDHLLVHRYGTVPAAEIALELGRGCAAVYVRAQILGLTEGNPPPYTEWEDAQIRAGYRQGLRPDAIALLIGRTLLSVRTRASKLRARSIYANEDWSQEELDRLLDLANEGHRYLKIIEILEGEGYARRTKAGLGPKLRQLGYRRGWGRRWQPEEDDLLRAAYRDGASLVPLRQRLGRSQHSIKWRAEELGLQGTHPNKDGFRSDPCWTPAEDEKLRELYGKIPTRELCVRLGRKRGGVFQRAWHMGLKHGYWRPYTPDELRAFRVAFVRGISIADLAIALNRHAMTVSKYATDKLHLHFGRRPRIKPPLSLEEILALPSQPKSGGGVTALEPPTVMSGVHSAAIASAACWSVG